MAVEYIDSPNAGFVKLGEGVDLSTITPQRKRKVKKGDRAIFPITPTGAESYETTDFRPAAGFTSPASTIPNVFERYRTVPGGARAGGAGPSSSFERVILPINPNGTKESITEDLELEEQLRRKSFDIGLDADPSGRTDPSSPNYDPQAVADRDRQVDENQAMMQAGIGFQDSVKVGIQDALYRASGGKRGQSFTTSLMNATLQNGNPFGLTLIDGDSDFVEGKGKNNNTIGTTTAAGILGIDVSALDTGGPTLGGARGSTGGTGFTTNVPKASNQEFIDAFTFGGTGTTLDAISGLGSAPTGVPSFSGSVGRSGMFGLPDVRSDIGETPTPTGFNQDAANAAAAQANLDSIDIPSGVDIDIPGGGGSFSVDADAVTVETPDGFVESFGAKDGGKVQSFMNIKK